MNTTKKYKNNLNFKPIFSRLENNFLTTKGVKFSLKKKGND